MTNKVINSRCHSAIVTYDIWKLYGKTPKFVHEQKTFKKWKMFEVAVRSWIIGLDDALHKVVISYIEIIID